MYSTPEMRRSKYGDRFVSAVLALLIPNEYVGVSLTQIT